MRKATITISLLENDKSENTKEKAKDFKELSQRIEHELLEQIKPILTNPQWTLQNGKVFDVVEAQSVVSRWNRKPPTEAALAAVEQITEALDANPA
jgi:hypothetical protein